MPYRYRHHLHLYPDHNHHHVQKGFTEEEAIERAGKVFESLDKNNDGGLAEDEFVKVLLTRTSWCMKREELNS